MITFDAWFLLPIVGFLISVGMAIFHHGKMIGMMETSDRLFKSWNASSKAIFDAWQKSIEERYDR